MQVKKRDNINESEQHLFVLWPNAHEKKSNVISVIEKYFIIESCLDLMIDRSELKNKICRIYGISDKAASERISISGVGKVTIFCVLDPAPTYETIWRHGTGYTLTNSAISECKSKLRLLLGHPFLMHSSNDVAEARKDKRILLGNQLNSQSADGYEVFNNDCDLFSYLEDVDDYLVLRDYTSGDIDVLTRCTPDHYAKLLNGKHSRLRFIDFPNQANLRPIDVVNVHHGIFCPIWCENMLLTKQYDTLTKRSRPDPENLLFSLMYHYVMHKKKIPLLGKNLMVQLINELRYSKLQNIDFTSKKESVYHLSKFMVRNNYSIPNPIDSEMYFDTNVATYLRENLGFHSLTYDPRKLIQTKNSHTTKSNNSLKEKFDGIDLLNLAESIASQINGRNPSKKTIAFSKGCSVFEKKSLYDYGQYKLQLNNGGLKNNYLLKVFYSPYKAVLDQFDRAFNLVTTYDARFLNQPIKHQRFGNLLISIENYVEGEVIDKFIIKNKRTLSDLDIQEKLITILNNFRDLNLNHGDIHAKNIIVTENRELKLIDFKFASRIGNITKGKVSLFKSTSDYDENSTTMLIKYLQSLRSGGQIKGLYNPNIDSFIDKKFKMAFPEFNGQIRGYKAKVLNFENLFLQRCKNFKQMGEYHKRDSSLTSSEKFLLEFSDRYSNELESIRTRGMH